MIEFKVCNDFQQMVPSVRMKDLRRIGIGFRCLVKGHFACDYGANKKRCGINGCMHFHNTILSMAAFRICSGSATSETWKTATSETSGFRDVARSVVFILMFSYARIVAPRLAVL